MLWFNENRSNIKTDHFPVNEDGEHCYPDGDDNAGEPLVGRDKVTMITKKTGELWRIYPMRIGVPTIRSSKRLLSPTRRLWETRHFRNTFISHLKNV
jgi:hypothetical protein